MTVLLEAANCFSLFWKKCIFALPAKLSVLSILQHGNTNGENISRELEVSPVFNILPMLVGS